MILIFVRLIPKSLILWHPFVGVFFIYCFIDLFNSKFVYFTISILYKCPLDFKDLNLPGLHCCLLWARTQPHIDIWAVQRRSARLCWLDKTCLILIEYIFKITEENWSRWKFCFSSKSELEQVKTQKLLYRNISDVLHLRQSQ